MTPDRRLNTAVRTADKRQVTQFPEAHPVMTALARRVPLTLLLDLADPAGPDSRQVLATETADLTWLRGLAFPAQTQPGAAVPA